MPSRKTNLMWEPRYIWIFILASRELRITNRDSFHLWGNLKSPNPLCDAAVSSCQPARHQRLPHKPFERTNGQFMGQLLRCVDQRALPREIKVQKASSHEVWGRDGDWRIFGTYFFMSWAVPLILHLSYTSYTHLIYTFPCERCKIGGTTQLIKYRISFLSTHYWFPTPNQTDQRASLLNSQKNKRTVYGAAFTRRGLEIAPKRDKSAESPERRTKSRSPLSLTHLRCRRECKLGILPNFTRFLKGNYSPHCQQLCIFEYIEGWLAS